MPDMLFLRGGVMRSVRHRPSGYAGHADEAWWTGLPGLTINRRSLAPAPGSAQVAQLVEHATENRSVGGSIPPLGTIKVTDIPSKIPFPCWQLF